MLVYKSSSDIFGTSYINIQIGCIIYATTFNIGNYTFVFMTQLYFRNAETCDLDFLNLLEKKAFPSFQQNARKNIKNGIKSSLQKIFIVEIGIQKEPIASFVLFQYKKLLRIYSIAVLPEYQNQGIGEKLLKYIFEFALHHQLDKITLEAHSQNTKLIRWYNNRGFKSIEEVQNYYGDGENAIKLEYKISSSVHANKTNNVIVINQPYKWDFKDINAKVITVKDYINDPVYQNNSDFRIFNLCSSYKYQTYGYYISLLASARGQRVIPSTTAIRDMRIIKVIQSAAYDIESYIDQSLHKVKENTFTLNIYFGQTNRKGFKTLATKLHQLFELPLFKVDFLKHDKWIIKDIKVLTLPKIPAFELDDMYKFATQYFNKKRYSKSKLTNFKYDLAILVNPKEETPPSCPTALQKFKNAANKKGVYVEFITKNDKDKINEFDALFIRETTNVNDHTYEISRMAYAEGLIVIDDPWSILRCSNKIYQNEIFKKHKILTPKTTVLTKNFFKDKHLDELKFPLVLKQPDSAFSLGITKVNNKEEALIALNNLFNKSDMVICQEFLYSEFDWRIGLLDNKPLFACKYYMSKGHWQIYNWKSNDNEEFSGDSETLPIKDVPEKVLQTAIKASGLIGDGLYGVDLKLVDNKVYVVEVNDNPNIDYGIEDLVLKDNIYDLVIDSLINRIEVAKNIQKINFTNQNAK